MLVHAHPESADDQWLYLPALKRVKRISSSNRSGSFMGSEFAYEDMTAQAVEKFTYRRDELRVWKVEYYDRKNAHLKTLTLENYEQYLNRYWRAGVMTMVNHLTGKSTVLTWADYQFRTDLEDRDFTRTGLKRVR